MSEEEKKLELAFYQIIMVYKDGKDLKLNMAPNQMKQFFDDLNQKKIFWYGDETPEPERGFWTNLDEVRYVQVLAIKGVRHEDNQPAAPAVTHSQAAADVSKVEPMQK